MIIHRVVQYYDWYFVKNEYIYLFSCRNLTSVTILVYIYFGFKKRQWYCSGYIFLRYFQFGDIYFSVNFMFYLKHNCFLRVWLWGTNYFFINKQNGTYADSYLNSYIIKNDDFFKLHFYFQCWPKNEMDLLTTQITIEYNTTWASMEAETLMSDS